MADDTDGIEEAVEGNIRLAVIAGARVGAEISRAWEDRLRQRQAGDALQARQLEQRFAAEKQVAVAELSQVYQPQWWDRADPAQVGQMYATATAWAPQVDQAAQAQARMRAELQDRFGIDVSLTDPHGVSAAVDTWQRRLEEQRAHEAGQENHQANTERTEATLLVGLASSEDRRAEQEREAADRAEGRASRVDRNPWLADSGVDRDELSARLQLDEVGQQKFWDRPVGQATSISRVYDLTVRYPHLTEAGQAEKRIREEVKERFGLEISPVHTQDPLKLKADILDVQSKLTDIKHTTREKLKADSVPEAEWEKALAEATDAALARSGREARETPEAAPRTDTAHNEGGPAGRPSLREVAEVNRQQAERSSQHST